MNRILAWFLRRQLRHQLERLLERWLKRPLTRKEKQAMKNWKTTLLGVLAGLTGGSIAGWTAPDGSIHWGAVALAVIMAALGHFTKDRDVTGGKIQQ